MAEIKVKQGDVVRVGEVLMTFTTGEVEKEAQRQPQWQPAEVVQPAEQPRRGGGCSPDQWAPGAGLASHPAAGPGARC